MMTKTLQSRGRRDYFTIIGIIVFVALALALFFGLLRLQRLFQEDLTVRISPSSQSFFLEPGQQAPLVLWVNASTKPLCRASCSYAFDDLSSTKILDNASFSFSRAYRTQLTYSLSVSRVGSGQNLYSFRIRCLTEDSLSCKQKETASSVLIALNYDLSAAQKLLREQTKTGLANLLALMNSTDSAMQGTNDKLLIVSSAVNMQELVAQKNTVNEHFARMRVDIEELRALWYAEQYPQLPALIANYTEQISSLEQDIASLDASITNAITAHNARVTIFNTLVTTPWQDLASQNLAAQDQQYLSTYLTTWEFLRNISLEMNNSGFQNYGIIDVILASANTSLATLQHLTFKNFNNITAQGIYLLDVEQRILCITKGICAEPMDLSSISIDKPADPAAVPRLCSDIMELEKAYGLENEKSENVSIPGYSNTTLQQYYKAMLAALSYNLTAQDALAFVLLNATSYAAQSIQGLIPFDPAQFPEPLNASSQSLYAGLSLNASPAMHQFSKRYCEMQNISVLPMLTPLVPYSFSSNFTALQTINTSLYDVPPRCCVFGSCKPCCIGECAQNPELYPIILLHGHAFNKENSAAYSLDAFNRIQTRLEKQGYLPAGVVTPLSKYTDFREGEWGLSGRPVVVKASYYFTSYYTIGQNVVVDQKSENIETYAIRLKEIIDVVKHRTGKDKVILITHSMGGLVGRSYLQIFGDESVYKLVMIASPNHGIIGSINAYCPLLGERNECNDMAAGSLFMRRLGSANAPMQARLYTIAGTGCITADAMGDGITRLGDAQLSYAKNYVVEGSCGSFIGTDLHSEILNPNKYNKTMDYLEIILRENPR